MSRTLPGASPQAVQKQRWGSGCWGQQRGPCESGHSLAHEGETTGRARLGVCRGTRVSGLRSHCVSRPALRGTAAEAVHTQPPLARSHALAGPPHSGPRASPPLQPPTHPQSPRSRGRDPGFPLSPAPSPPRASGLGPFRPFPLGGSDGDASSGPNLSAGAPPPGSHARAAQRGGASPLHSWLQNSSRRATPSVVMSGRCG